MQGRCPTNLAPRSAAWRSGRRGAAAPRGFTLVEVLVVVVVIGIAAAIVVPAMLRAGTLSVQAAARMVIADVLYAQNDAIAQQSTRRVVFDPAQNRYRLTDGNGQTLTAGWLGGTAGNYVIDFANDSRFRGVVLQNVDFNGSATLEFDPLGSPSEGGAVEVLAAGARYRVSVAPVTGRVTVAPVPGN